MSLAGQLEIKILLFCGVPSYSLCFVLGSRVVLFVLACMPYEALVGVAGMLPK